MKKILLILGFLLILTSNISCAKTIKFVQIAEPQYGNPQSEEILNNAIKEINSMKDVKFVVFTGDNTEYADEKLLTSFIKTAKKLNKPFFITVGDKDMSKKNKLERSIYTKKLHKLVGHKYPKTLNYTFKFRRSNVLFVVVDGAKDFIIMPNGYFNEKTLNWLDETIKLNQDKKIVILQHFPIATKTDNNFILTANAPEYLKVINNYDNVISLVAGHFNKNDETSINGVYYIVTPSLAAQKCYKIIEINEDNGYQVFTTLIKMD